MRTLKAHLNIRILYFQKPRRIIQKSTWFTFFNITLNSSRFLNISGSGRILVNEQTFLFSYTSFYISLCPISGKHRKRNLSSKLVFIFIQNISLIKADEAINHCFRLKTWYYPSNGSING